MSIQFEVERMERLAADLDLLRISGQIPVTDYLRKEGKQEDGAICDTEGWTPCCISEPWSELCEYRWYRTRVQIPKEMGGKRVEFRFITGREGQWDATNPQMLFYVNGRPVQGIDVNHRQVLLEEKAKAGTCIDIAFLVFTGSVPGDLIIRTDLITVDWETEQAYYDFLVPVQTARLLKNSDYENYRRILTRLAPAADILDLRQPYTERYYASLHRMRDILKEEFYTKVDENAPVVSAIGHTHIDIAWLWTVGVTREKAVRSFSTVLELMDQYPNYRFMSSQPILYQFVKEQEPELYEKIREKIREGRWETDGAMWLESDCNLPAGESLVRQVMKGEQFFMEEFGIPSKCLWLPDVFGYSAAIPQILKKSGVPYFLTTKIAWNQFNQLPNDTFIWKGIDGSDVFVFMPTTCDFDKTLGLNISFTDTRNTTTYTGIVNPNMTLGTFKRFQNRDLTENTLMLFGFGDGGGGPTREMLEEAERLKYGMPGIPRLVQEPERVFFDRIHEEIASRPDMPEWNGELYFEYHRGTLTSMGKNKRNNRKSEILYEQLETLGVMGEAYGQEYPAEILKSGWDIILLNHFHDIIPGSAIEAVYDQTDVEYVQIRQDGMRALSQLTDGIAEKIHGEDTQNGEETTIFVYNTQGYDRDDVVCIDAEKVKGWNRHVTAMVDAEGNLSPVQYAANGDLLFFAQAIPSVGYKSFVPVMGEPDAEQKKIWDGSFENAYYRVQFDDQMRITSLVEKETEHEFIKEGTTGNRLVTYEDRPMNWDNWDLDMFYKKKPYEADEVSAPELMEAGPVRTVVRIRRRFADSIVDQDVILYPELPRIDFKTSADWQDHHVLLRTLFPVDVNSTKASYEIQFGNVERETTHNQSWDTAKFEVCAHKWSDLSEQGLGISLLNDCKYGHSVRDGEMGLTLIKSGVYPNENADIGHHEFTYAIYPHAERWQDARTIEMAYDLNIPLHTSIVEGADIRTESSMIAIAEDHCFFETIKRAEDGDGYILRIYENKNKRSKIHIAVNLPVSEVIECDLMERPLAKVSFENGVLEDSIKPYEIKTYRLHQA